MPDEPRLDTPTGRAARAAAPEDGASGRLVDACERCGGSGRVDGQACPDCGGSGRVTGAAGRE